MSIPSEQHNTRHINACARVPEFERINYFYGQMLGANDFRAEQAYFREKLKLINRCLHGYGVVCGLGVKAKPTERWCESEADKARRKKEQELGQVDKEIDALEQQIEKAKTSKEDIEELSSQLRHAKIRREEIQREMDNLPAYDPKPREPGSEVVIECGMALDCEGNELVVRGSLSVDLKKHMGETGQHQNDTYGDCFYLSLCYCAQPMGPVRPVLPEACGTVSECNYGKIRDSVRVIVSLEEPVQDQRCEQCCTPCENPCVLLARITMDASGAVTDETIDNSVRRSIGLYKPTVVTGISWQHGSTYSWKEAAGVLGTDPRDEQQTRTNGIEVAFSRPVLAETLASGVVDLWRIHGGKGQRGVISYIEGQFVDVPDSGTVNSFKYRDESGETLDTEDRILITVRTSFILDECCQPVDGFHVGGRVPLLADYRMAGTKNKQSESQLQHCLQPPGGFGPWTSGNGVPGGTFDSWFYVE